MSDIDTSELRKLLLTEPAITAAANAISPDATHPEDIACAREAATEAITAALEAIAPTAVLERDRSSSTVQVGPPTTDINAVRREAAADALTAAADVWQWGGWTVLTEPIKAAEQPQRIIGAAQAVTDWLRARAESETT